MAIMQRTFRSMRGRPWWFWRALANRRDRLADTGIPLEDIFGATSGYYPVTLENTFTDATATTPCTADGDLVAAWVPSLGSLPMLVQATEANRPTLKADGDGWRLDFDGLGDRLLSAATVTGNAEQLLALACERATEASDTLLWVGTAISSAHRINGVASGQRLQASQRVAAGTNYSALALTDTFPTATEYVASSLLTADSLDIQGDLGTPVSAAAVAGEIATSTINIQPTTAMKVWGMAVHQAATITDAEREAVVQALAALQGRTLS